MPYLYTQCEDIACRSVAPMMDTPAIKITYGAFVTVPTEPKFVVYVSANATGAPLMRNNQTTYGFYNQIRMPSYLIAIAVGDLEYQSTGRRTGVITEPSKLNETATCLEDLETHLNKMEECFRRDDEAAHG